MKKFANGVVRNRKLIAVIGILLMIPAAFGYMHTRVNYDLLAYLPEDIETVKGQYILMDDFNKGSFAMLTFEGIEDKEIVEIKDEIENLEYVDSVIWYDDVADISIPRDMLPDDIYEKFNNGDCTMMAAFMNVTISSDEAISTIKQMRKIAGKGVYVSSMSAFVTDLKYIGDNEEPVYVAIAALLACVVMSIFLDSFLLPWLFLFCLGISIVLNLGSNIVFGEISYITKCISAVLQLGVTMDYSIFLWNSYKEERGTVSDKNKAMSKAICKTLTAVSASSITTIAGFIALCFMSFTLGLDLGLVMAKGVLIGVITSVTVLPSLILMLDKLIEKTKHRQIIFKAETLSDFILKHRRKFAVLYILILGPALFGYMSTDKYYDLDRSIPESTLCRQAQEKLEEEFNINQTHMLLCKSDLSAKECNEMIKEIENVDGVGIVLSQSSLLGETVPDDMMPSSFEGMLCSNGRQLLIITSKYKAATDEINSQIDEINSIVDNYDKDGILIGEAACTKDLISITDHDFSVVTVVSILAVFIIIMVSLGSAVLPVILIGVIELAIFINLGIPYYAGTKIAFINPICVSTIQLGATVDYAILMTTRYKQERISGENRYEAIRTALSTSIPSIVISALGFFAATFGVGIYSDIEMVGSMCQLMSRGAIISMLLVIFILPSFLYMFDGIICKTTRGMRRLEGKRGDKNEI